MSEYQKNIICERAEICPIYENWIEQTKNHRLDIIIKTSGNTGGPGCSFFYKHYNCLALDAIGDKENGIPMNQNLKNRIKSDNLSCTVLEILENSKK